jgi:hypothetical protein
MTSQPMRPETSDTETGRYPDDATRVDEGGRHAGTRPSDDDSLRTDAVRTDDSVRTGDDVRDDSRRADEVDDRDMRTTGDVDTSYRTGSPSDQVAAAAGPAGTASASGNGSSALLGEHQDLSDRWDRVQATFVDDPRKAVAEAAGLVEDTLSRLNDTFARERTRGEGAGDDASGTEDLRQAMQRYREFFRRLLAA